MGEEKGICRQSSRLLLSVGFAHTLINVCSPRNFSAPKNRQYREIRELNSPTRECRLADLPGNSLM